MKKKTIKKLKLKESIKTALVISGLLIAMIIYLFIASARLEAIQNNPEGYTESGHAHSVEINFKK